MFGSYQSPEQVHCLLMKTLQKGSPHGLVFRRDVGTTGIIKKFVKNKASGIKMTERSTFTL